MQDIIKELLIKAQKQPKPPVRIGYRNGRILYERHTDHVKSHPGYVRPVSLAHLKKHYPDRTPPRWKRELMKILQPNFKNSPWFSDTLDHLISWLDR